MKNLCFALLACCALSLFVGCGPKPIKTEGVTGTITINGVPTAGVNVTFISFDGTGSDGYAMTDKDGKYQLQTLAGAANAGTTPGKYAVKFDYKEQIEDGTFEENGETKTRYKEKLAIDKKWTNEKTSGVMVDVVTGDNTFDFDIN